MGKEVFQPLQGQKELGCDGGQDNANRGTRAWVILLLPAWCCPDLKTSNSNLCDLKLGGLNLAYPAGPCVDF